jgi:curli production assembly/transport component CsgF
MRSLHILWATGAVALSLGSAAAGDLVYQPVNPNFGGNPFNGEFLLGQAQLQNQHDDVRIDPIDDFQGGLQARLLGRVSAEIEDRLFGENPQDSGIIPVGDLEIRFERIGNFVELTIIDLVTGGETVIEIPAPAF